MQLLRLSGILLLLACSNVQATLVDFDSITLGSSAPIPSGYAGFDWTAYDPLTMTVGGTVQVGTGNNATTSGAYSIGTIGFEIARTNGTLFDVTSFIAAYEFVNLSDIVISGFNNNTLTHQLTVLLGTAPELVNTGFAGIDLLRVESGSIDTFSLDNLTVTAVPIPPALWLFLSGIMGLAGVGRRYR